MHADPHQGNLFVRKDPKTKRDQVVLLDHGLYKNLDVDFRTKYAQMWQSLLFADMDSVAESCKNMNAGSFFSYVVHNFYSSLSFTY